MPVPRRLLGVVVGLVAVGVLGAATYARIRDREAEAGAGERQVAAGDSASRLQPGMEIPVEGEPVVKGTMLMSVTASGQAVASRQTRLLAQVEGRITQLPVRENGGVAPGQLVLAIDPQDFQIQLDQAKLTLQQREATFTETTLFDDRITDSALRAERAQAARIRSGVDAARLDVERAELNLRRTRLTAPFAGLIADLKVVPGQMVRVGDEIASVVDVDPIHVEVRVLEGDIGQLRTGGAGRVTFAAYPDEEFRGVIESVNPVVDQTTRTARVLLRIPNPGRRILPGMYAQVSLDARAYTDRVMVPRAAVLERDRDRRKLVFVLENGTAKWNYVSTGLENDTHIEIVPNEEFDPIVEGQVVLTKGHYTLVHGAPVRLVENSRVEGGRPR